MSSLAQRRESPRRPAPGINWLFIGGIAISIACLERRRLAPVEDYPLSNDGPRYQAEPTILAQVAIDACVLDTMTLNPYNRPTVVAVCPDLETAQMIALALNGTADT